MRWPKRIAIFVLLVSPTNTHESERKQEMFFVLDSICLVVNTVHLQVCLAMPNLQDKHIDGGAN
jgi:hypothetical protein